MKTIINNRFFTLFFIAVLFISCSDDDADTTKPVINLISPADGDTLIIGRPIDFDAVFEDNEEMASYKVDIHHNFNNHGHQHSVKSTTTTPDTLSFNKIWYDIAGKKQANVHHHEIEIPGNTAPGKYHFMVYCVDNSGNESYIAHSIVLAKNEETE